MKCIGVVCLFASLVIVSCAKRGQESPLAEHPRPPARELAASQVVPLASCATHALRLQIIAFGASVEKASYEVMSRLGDYQEVNVRFRPSSSSDIAAEATLRFDQPSRWLEVQEKLRLISGVTLACEPEVIPSVEKNECSAPRQEQAKQEQAKQESPKQEAPKQEAPQQEEPGPEQGGVGVGN